MIKKSQNITPKKGMNRNFHPSEVTAQEYTFALNANIQEGHGDGDLILVNEPSNLKCTGFKDGYFVVKHKYDRVRNRTYFFLTNPITGCSEIGYINMNFTLDPTQIVTKECNCTLSVVVEDGLENIIQEGICEYITIISDYCEELEECTGCLGFSLNEPVTDVSIRHSISGDELYFTQIGKPQRYIKLDYIADYFFNKDECTGESTAVCLKCDDIRIFNLYNFPCLDPKIIQGGGNLQSGIYEVALAYSTISGEEISDYIAFTNYVSIIDYNNNVLDQTSLDYRTNQAFSVEVSNLDLNYDFYKIVIIYRSGNNPAPIYIPYGIYSTSQTEFTVSSQTSIQNGDTVTVEELLRRRTVYLSADGLSDVGGYLFQHGLTPHREINLQPIVNFLGSFVKWGSSRSLEKLYKNGIASANYKTYPREEVFPLSIVFKKRGGYKTPNFLFIPRPPLAGEIAEVEEDDTNYLSITASASNCSEEIRNKIWQFYDTSEVEGVCPQGTATTEEQVITQTESCLAEGHVIEEGIIPESFSIGIAQWIEENRAEILASSDPALADIKDALTEDSYYEECIPEFGDTCEEPTLVSEVIVVTGVENQRVEDVSVPQSEYPQILPPESCDSLVEPPVTDTEIENALPAGSSVNEKTTPSNTSCNVAPIIETFFAGVAGTGYHLKDEASIGTKAPLITSQAVTLTSDVFEPFLHSNAVYFQAQFLTSDRIIVELSQVICNATDDNTSNSVRITVFDGCPTLTEKPAYGRIITDLTDLVDTDRFIELESADFTGNAYIVVDSPMRSDHEFDLNITGTSGTSTLTIDGDVYTATFNTDLATTTANFYSASVVGWNAQGILHNLAGTTITLRMSEDLYDTIVVANVTGDLLLVESNEEEYHTLQPPCGCFAIYKREVIYTSVVAYDSITFAKEYTYEAECTYEVQELSDCDPIPYQYGKFSYWESGIKYPCNEELYDSSGIKIKPSDILSSIRDDFEDYYVTGGSAAPQVDGDGNYVFTSEANFMDKQIRHYKFPSNVVSPFMSAFASVDNISNESIIYPIGFVVDNETINSFLDIAVTNGYLSIEERNDIVGYEIFRGDRTTERSVIAKGILFNMMSYVDVARSGGTTYYQNYPLNDSRQLDNLNANSASKVGNFMFSFQSPDTSYENPTLTFELGIDGYQTGVSYNSFAPYKNHPKYSILGRRSRTLATTLAGLEVTAEVLEFASTLLVQGSAGGISAPLAVAAAIAAGISFTISTLFRFGNYRYEWLNTFQQLGAGYNHAYIGLAEGQYYNFTPNTTQNSILRGLEISSYLNTGNKRLTQETTGTRYFVNNFQREKAVFFKTQDIYPFNYSFNDTSRLNIPTQETGKLGVYTLNTYSPYGTMKQYTPNQYGEVNSISWLNTGYCGVLDQDNECEIIYGGDTYITRHSVVRKFPFFTETAYKQQFDTPFKYSSYFNINTGFNIGRGFIDFKTAEDTFSASGLLFPDIKSAYSLWDGSQWVTENNNNEFYIKDDNKFLVNYFGCPYFLVESEVNCWNRYAGVEEHENFYPNADDTLDWLQEDRFSIREKETFRYNRIFSSRVHRKLSDLLPVNYSKELWDKKDDLSNAVIYSQQDNDNSLTRSPWLNYKALDFYRFSNEYGTLIDVRGIESEQILFRFTDGISILGAVDQLRDRLTSTNSQLGIGGIFVERALNFNKTDLGYGGTQHKAITSTPFGHYWADAKRGKVFELSPNAKEMPEISISLDKWFKEHLPFKILQTYPQVNVDRAYAGLGLSLGWDDRLKRVFLTKLDYIPKVKDLNYSEELGFYEGEISCPEGYTLIDGQCVMVEESEKIQIGEGFPLINAGNSAHGMQQPALYSVYNSNGTANVNVMSPTGFTFEVLPELFWTGSGVVANRLTTKFGKWVDGAYDLNVWYGGSTLIDVPETKTYYVILAADNLFRFSVDGVVILTSDATAIGPQHTGSPGAYLAQTFRQVHIYPYRLTEGCHIVTLEGLNQGSDAMFGGAILNNTAQELRDATSYSDLNYIYSTEFEDEFFEEVVYECPEGFTPVGDEVCDICTREVFAPVNYTQISFENEDYFEKAHWTVAYSPITKTWISYYSFTPNYYNSYTDYFQTGVNSTGLDNGLWTHHPLFNSYQVFYGSLYPFIVETSSQTNATNSLFESMEFYLQVRRYYNYYDFADIVDKGFNKAYIYNSFQNTGQLNLTIEKENDMSQWDEFPKQNTDATDILQSEIEGRWSFNYIYNHVKNERSGFPIWINDNVQINKTLNPDAMEYDTYWKDRLRGDYFLSRLVQDEFSQYKMFYRIGITNRDFYA